MTSPQPSAGTGPPEDRAPAARSPAAGLPPTVGLPPAARPPAAGSTPGARALVVVGARGGAGTTTVAGALARSLGRSAPTALVQLGSGPAIDAVLGTEDLPGLRWPDLADADGPVDPHQLAAGLRRWAGVSLLTGDDGRDPPPPSVLPTVLDALVGAHRHVVVDVDRAGLLHPTTGPLLLARCRTVLLVVPRDVPAVTGARHLTDRLGAGIDTRLVVRGPGPGGLGPAEVAVAIGLPLAVALPADRGLARAIDAGAGPLFGRRAARSLARLARVLV